MKNLSLVSLINVTIVGSSVAGFVCLSLLDSSIKSLLLLIISAITCLILVRASAATRHLVWATTMIGLLLMPACAVLLPTWQVLPAWLALESRIEILPPVIPPIAIDQPVGTRPVELPRISLPESVSDNVQNLPTSVHSPAQIVTVKLPFALRLSASIVLGLWGTGCIICLTPIALAFLHLRHTERAYKKYSSMSPELLRHITKVANELEIEVPRVIIGPSCAMPMVWTFWKSRLLLPAGIEHWSTNQLNAVLLHELVHLKRRDPTWFLLGLIARALNWPNPLAWYAAHRLRIECERACDDHVLRMGIDASDYATHLLELSTNLRTASRTGSLALAMSDRSNVETRIVSILNEKMNRRGITMRRAVGVLAIVIICVTSLSRLAATATEKSNANHQVQNVPLKYPYCVVEVDDLKPRSLDEAITLFNKEAMESPTGVLQPLITEQETLNAIAKFVELDHVAELTKAMLREIAISKTLPANAYFRRFTRFDDARQMHGVWWVRLFVEAQDTPALSVPIRTTPIFSRPYTQMERQQNAEDGITLINRFTSYFEELPTIRLKQDFPQEAIDRFIVLARKAIDAKDLDAVKELFHWQGVRDSTRDFVTSETQMLFKATIHSIKIEPRALDGNLIHWSAFQRYQPNLPIVGFMEIEYTPNALVGDVEISFIPETGSVIISGSKPNVERVQRVIGEIKDRKPNQSSNDNLSLRKTLSLELGKIGDDFRLVNYVAIGERNLPEGKVEGLSIRGNMETQADGTHLLTSLITNPGSLISAHLANEEIQQRGLEPAKEEILSILENRNLQLNEKLERSQKTVEDLRKRMDELVKQLNDLQGKDFKYVQGKITEVGKDGDTVYINLGKADELRPGVSFGVIGLAVPGIRRVSDFKPIAKIEVVEVLTTSEHLSRCKVLSIHDENTIQIGDAIYSPSWKPGRKVEFALVGKMDIDGDGKDDRDKVTKMIEQNGGLVTFDLPPVGNATGVLSENTRWMVIGEDFTIFDKERVLESQSKLLGINRIRLDKLMGWLGKSGMK